MAIASDAVIPFPTCEFQMVDKNIRTAPRNTNVNLSSTYLKCVLAPLYGTSQKWVSIFSGSYPEETADGDPFSAKSSIDFSPDTMACTIGNAVAKLLKLMCLMLSF